MTGLADVTAAPSEILAATEETPVGHPSRAVLRERAIRAWLPLAGVRLGAGMMIRDLVDVELCAG
ncbi:hypothetical protein [Paractinoplanes brasiliensis]|uniref:hypothetical protein n=1 Tax=Paractinoplanes brasiliensis TaxID=52695 RepID=UPI00105CEFAF|nr:hypothetical protein [Actinoplanes brasiliensis]